MAKKKEAICTCGHRESLHAHASNLWFCQGSRRRGKCACHHFEAKKAPKPSAADQQAGLEAGLMVRAHLDYLVKRGEITRTQRRNVMRELKGKF